jgi:hypothetical protein
MMKVVEFESNVTANGQIAIPAASHHTFRIPRGGFIGPKSLQTNIVECIRCRKMVSAETY